MEQVQESNEIKLTIKKSISLITLPIKTLIIHVGTRTALM